MKGARTGIYLRAEINMVSRALHVFHYYIVHFPALTRASLTIIAWANHISRPLQELLFSYIFRAYRTCCVLRFAFWWVPRGFCNSPGGIWWHFYLNLITMKIVDYYKNKPYLGEQFIKHLITKVMHFIRGIVCGGKIRNNIDISLRSVQGFPCREHFGGFLSEICTSVDVHEG